MAFYKKLSKQVNVGFLIFIIITASFIFLLLSPYIPNFIGKYRDEQLLAGCNERIQAYRMGGVRIQVVNQTTLLPIENWNVSYELKQHEFLFGCNCFEFDSFEEPGYNESYRDYFQQLFNFAILPFYWEVYEPAEGYFPTEAHSINATRDWCLQNNITLKGHPILWSREYKYPDWWLPVDNDTLMMDALESRVTTVVSKYQGQIDYWDVVNEPIHTIPFAHMSRVDYVYNALTWANETNPDAHLCINDYGIIGHDFGNGPYYNLLSDLIARDAPFELIGLQSHDGAVHADWIPATEIWRTLDAYAKLGKPIHITEFMPTSAPVPITNSWKKGIWTEEAQAEYASRVYKLAFSHPAMKGVIWWHFTDFDNWITGGGMLNATLEPKPVYDALDQLINQEWKSVGAEMTNSTGWVEFTGYYGLYNISIQNGQYQSQVKVESGSPNQFILEI